MIIFDTSLQDCKDELPKEVYAWLTEKNENYPRIRFIVDFFPINASNVEQYAPVLEKYSRVFAQRRSPSGMGVHQVIFNYPGVQWTVKITGLVNDRLEFVDVDSAEANNSLPIPANIRNEIAGIGGENKYERIGDSLCEPRPASCPPLPPEMVATKPDGRYTSAVSFTGEELNSLLQDPDKGGSAKKAIWKKDWETLRGLKER